MDIEDILQWITDHRDALTWLFGGGVLTTFNGLSFGGER